VRQGHALVPQRETRLVANDEVLIVTTTASRGATERRLRAVSRRGKLARWFGEHGDADPA
jgi:cell volume regulation protein A